MRSRATAALLVAAALVSGCGPAAKTDSAKNFTGTERDVAEVIDRLSDAATKRDAKKICAELLSPESVAAIVKTQGKACKDGLRPLISATTTREIKVKKVVVNGDRATAAVAIPTTDKDQRATMSLRKIGATWRVVLVGEK